MTKAEAEKIAKVIGHADNGCRSCVRCLVELLNEAGLGFRFEMTGEDVEEPLQEGELLPDRYAQVVVAEAQAQMLDPDKCNHTIGRVTGVVSDGKTVTAEVTTEPRRLKACGVAKPRQCWFFRSNRMKQENTKNGEVVNCALCGAEVYSVA